jgi:2-polyprenyl-6-methoxyphenol hydroxylase-like FAD-dependent oxidoreductase
LRPGNERETTVLLTFLRERPDIDADEAAARKRLLRQALKDRGTIAERISSELDTVRDFYFGPMSQVQASTWSKGRFVLLSDAAHCPTPFTGQGTALALVGAYVLAGEIQRGATVADALPAYERLVRPYVEASQRQLTPRLIRLFHVKTSFGITLAHLAEKFFASAPVQRLFKPSDAKREREVTEDFVFPSYS